MRVIGGTFRSRKLRTLRGKALRPTSERLRETLFDILGPAVVDSLFIDAFAGTGAVGIEALSRGAREVIFLENHAEATALVRQNLESLGIESGAEVHRGDVLAGLEGLARKRCIADFIFLDPPYAAVEEYERVLEFLGNSRLVAPAGRVIAEHGCWQPPADRYGNLEKERLVGQGDAALSFYRVSRAA